MSFIKRLVYYLGGVGLGIILLMFFLSGKKTSCDYGPNARTLKFLKSKPLFKSDELQRTLMSFELDSAQVASVFIQGEVNFQKSEISNELPNIYSVFITFIPQGSFEFRFQVDEKVTELISIQPSDP